MVPDKNVAGNINRTERGLLCKTAKHETGKAVIFGTNNRRFKNKCGEKKSEFLFPASVYFVFGDFCFECVSVLK